MGALDTALRLLDWVGIAAFAVSGALVASRKQMDAVGFVLIAVVTGFGGGTLRDLLLGVRPVFWIADPRYVEVIIASAALTVLYARYRFVPERALLIADACGLALFAIAGAQIAEREQVHGVIVVALGTMTGCAGGLLRDVLVNDVPIILRQGQIYATAAIAGISLYLVLQAAGLTQQPAALCGMAAVAGLRLAAILWNLQLPVFRYPER